MTVTPPRTAASGAPEPLEPDYRQQQEDV